VADRGHFNSIFPLPNMTFSISEVLVSQSCTLMIITFSKLNTVPAFGYEVDGISTARSTEGAWPARANRGGAPH